jgi:hypothetical protein
VEFLRFKFWRAEIYFALLGDVASSCGMRYFILSHVQL